ncbi:MAG: amidohydrolase [Clostridia bacterium]|nr:amidohydrolase [Clostridia bacterium]
MVIDVHAHVYPEKIAIRAAQSIGEFYDVSMSHPGSVPELLRCMRQGGIDRALIHSVAMSPARAATINDFISDQVKEHPQELVGYATLHPDMTENEAGDEFSRAMGLGLKGIKLHNDMQKIAIDDPRMDKIYALCQDTCPLLLHMGDSRYHYDNPAQLPGVLRRFPRLRVIGAHMGGYTEWQQAFDCLLHEDVIVDCSSSYFVLGREGLLQAIRRFGADRVMFGTDFPMWDPGLELGHVRGLGLAEDELEKVLYKNAQALMGLCL